MVLIGVLLLLVKIYISIKYNMHKTYLQMFQTYLQMFGTYLGFFGPIILLLLTCGFLIISNKYIFLLFYFGGFVINVILNSVLKILIKEPRPSDDKHIFAMEVRNGNRISFDKFGMPSGHAQMAGYSIGFIYHIVKSSSIMNLYLVIALITMIQRFIFKNHTIMQLIVGFGIGIFIGFCTSYWANQKLVGNIRHKPDDNAPTLLFGL